MQTHATCPVVPSPARASEAVGETFAVQGRDLARCFGRTRALDRVSLAVRKGEFFSLLGPSGCGKTTLLRIIAGLDRPDEGTLEIGGRDAGAVPAHQRPVNTVFQSYALFPHLNVRDNLAFGLRMKKTPAADIARRVELVMALAQITPLADRRPAQLSGGQKQRVALARALVNEPEVLLLDEPLAALDLQLRRELRAELSLLQRRLHLTFIFVTHDQEEALEMSDRIAVMKDGQIEQTDRAKDLYERPRTRFVAGFVGSCNLIEGRVTRAGGTLAEVETAVGSLRVDLTKSPRRISAGDQVTLAIRPEKISLWPATTVSAGNQYPGRVAEKMYCGAETRFRINLNRETLNVRALNSQSAGNGGAEAGHSVVLHLPPDALIVLDD